MNEYRGLRRIYENGNVFNDNGQKLRTLIIPEVSKPVEIKTV